LKHQDITVAILHGNKAIDFILRRDGDEQSFLEATDAAIGSRFVPECFTRPSSLGAK
jgi:hypothetical protein